MMATLPRFLRACSVDLDLLKKNLREYIDQELDNLVSDGREDAKPTAGFQRVIQRAVIHVQSSGREEVTGANVLVAIFAERESHAAYFLQEQDMTRYDAVNYISHGIAKRPGLSDSSKAPRGADEEAEARDAKEGKEGGDSKKKEGALDAYCVNLNKKARDGRIDPLIGREAEVQRTIQVLVPAPQEQSVAGRRSRRRQDRDRRRPRPQDRQERSAGSSRRGARFSRSTWARCSPAPAIAAISKSA